MNRNIKEIFIQNNIKKRKTNIGYIVAGYPTVKLTKN